MIAPMTKYSFVLLNGQQDQLVEQLQQLGLIDISRSVKPVDEASQQLASDLDRIRGLVQGLRKVDIPEGTQLRECPQEEDLVRLAEGTLMLYSETRGQIAGLEKEIAAKKIWGNFDPDVLEKLSEAGVPLHFHQLSGKLFRQQWEQEYALSVVAREKNNTYFVVAGEDPLPGEIPVPSGNAAQAESALAEKEALLHRLEGEILGIQQQIPQLEDRLRELYARLDRHLACVSASPAAENTIVTLVGYAPTDQEGEVTRALDHSDVLYLKEDAQVRDNPPIQLKNNAFVKQFEVLTDMYGRPGYDGFDPTPFIAVFFLLFFALCMGDAGYGLILIAIGLLLKKIDSFKDMSSLVVTLGVGTVVVGFFLHTFFSIDIAQWKIFQPVQFLFLPEEIAGYAGGMVLSIVVGIVHLCLAMSVKAIHSVKVNGFAASLGTLGWTLLIVGGVVVGALSLIGVLNAKATQWILIVWA